MSLANWFKEDFRESLFSGRKIWLKNILTNYPEEYKEQIKDYFLRYFFYGYKAFYESIKPYFKENTLREKMKSFAIVEFENIFNIVNDLYFLRNFVYPNIQKNPFGGYIAFIIEPELEKWFENELKHWVKCYSENDGVITHFTGIWIFSEEDLKINPYLEAWFVDELLTFGRWKTGLFDEEFGVEEVSNLEFFVSDKNYYALKFIFPENHYYPYEVNNEEMKIWKEALNENGIPFRGYFYLDIYEKQLDMFKLSVLGGGDTEVYENLPNVFKELKFKGKL
jgi:hypothetical protein